MRTRVWIVCLALCIRLLPWQVSVWSGEAKRVMQSPDCVEYEQAALNLLEHRTLSIAGVPPIEPDSWRTPGYPLLVAGVYAGAGRSPHTVVFVHALLAAASCALLAWWAAPLVGTRAAAVAALVWAVDVGAVANAGILLSETLCLFWMMLAFGALFAIPREPRGALAGLFFALAALTRPAVLYLAAPAALALAVRERRAAVRPLATLGLAFAAVIALWIARNAVTTGAAEFSALEGQNLLFYRASGVMARVWGMPVDQAWKTLAVEAEAARTMQGLPKSRHGAVCKELALKYLKAHPAQYLPVLATGTVKAWTGLAIYDVLKHFGYDPKGLGLFEKGLRGIPERLAALTGLERAAVLFDLATRAAALILGGIGLAILARRRDAVSLVLILGVCAYVSLTAGTVISYYRFRLPATPLWCLAVGVALDSLRPRRVSSSASCAASQDRSASTDAP